MSAPEEWREVPDCPGYEVSSIGRARHNGRLLTVKMRPGHVSPYPQLTMKRADGTVWQPNLHSAMLRAFVGPRPSTNHVAGHLDGNPANNTIGNLAWITYRENAAHRRVHGTAGRRLTEEQAFEIRRRAAAGERQGRLAVEFGVGPYLVNHIVHNRVWRETSLTAAARTPSTTPT